MNPIGIIAEFNPFHIGHEYLIKQAKELFPESPVIISMSGNFVQRGEPAITDKWLRARMALQCGADIVFELPTVFAASSADLFASGGIKLLASTGLIKNIVCGAESADITILDALARVIDNEAFKINFRQNSDKGLSYADSFARACVASAAANNPLTASLSSAYEQALGHPNNLLAIHYLRAIRMHAPELKLNTIGRMAPDKYISASEIRRRITAAGNEADWQQLSEFIPMRAYEILAGGNAKNKLLIDSTPLWHILRHQLITTLPEIIADAGDISEGLENRIIQAFREAASLAEAIGLIKTKRYTRTRIQRCLMQLLLGITKNDLVDAYASGPRYLRVLGCSDAGMHLLHAIKKTCSVPLITRSGRKYLTKHMDSLSEPQVKRQLDLDLIASDIYTNLFSGRRISADSDSRKKIFTV